MQRRRLLLVLGVTAGIVIALLVVRMQLRISGKFTLLPEARSTIRAEVDGILAEILVDEGDTVRVGQTIARIDASGFQSQFKETRADMDKGEAELALLRTGPLAIEIDGQRKLVERARTQAAYTEKEYERIGELYRNNLVPANEYDKARQEMLLARADLERAENDLRVLAIGNRPERIREAAAQVERLRASLDFLSEQIRRTDIHSPIAGVVSTHRLRDRLKEYLETGDQICEIVGCERMLLEVPVSEKDVLDIRAGMPVEIKARSLPAASFPGRVVSVPPVAVDQSNRTVVVVTAAVDNPRHLLKPGMTGTARIYCGQRSVMEILTRRIVRFVRVEFWWL